MCFIVFVPRYGEAIGGDIEMLGIRLCVGASVTKLVNFRFHAPIYTIFDPVMHITIALDEFEDDLPFTYFFRFFLGRNAKSC